jgi:hypothetical protein
MHGGVRNMLEGRGHSEDQGVSVRILEWILEKWWEGVDWIHLLMIGTSGELL